jgi:hypothetical protein
VVTADELSDSEGPDLGEGAFAEDLASASLALARRFHAGATLWCASPGRPAHAHHVAVEFVHPVIVGKRALPAAVIDGESWVGRLRSLCRAGDALVVIGPADDPTTREAMQRARAWGLLTLWLGSGPRPRGGAADYVLWLDGEPGSDTFGGPTVLLYHLLWELTHVCFEHPGLLVVGEDCTEEVCITCSDEGRLGEIVSISDFGQARARTPSGVEDIDATLVDAHPGDLVLIHAGTAVALVPAGHP